MKFCDWCRGEFKHFPSPDALRPRVFYSDRLDGRRKSFCSAKCVKQWNTQQSNQDRLMEKVKKERL